MYTMVNDIMVPITVMMLLRRVAAADAPGWTRIAWVDIAAAAVTAATDASGALEDMAVAAEAVS